MLSKLFLFVKIVFCFSLLSYSPSFAEDDRDLFIRWLSAADNPTAQNLIFRAGLKFRLKYGPFASRYTDSSRTAWKPAFLDIADEEFSSRYGKSISSLCNFTNQQLKRGLSTAQSRYQDPSKKNFSEIFQSYLSTNLALIKQDIEPTTLNVNKFAWKQSKKVLPLESMGGNAGSGAIAVNFLTDLDGRIVFVGNFQDSAPEIIETYHKGLLRDGTVIYSVDPSLWQLKLSPKLNSDAGKSLTQSLIAYHGTHPIAENRVFRSACEETLKKLLRGPR